jgi:hypothetical protein
MNRSRRRRLALRVLAVMIGLGAIGAGGVAFAASDSGTAVKPGDTVIAPTQTGPATGGFASPNDAIWL